MAGRRRRSRRPVVLFPLPFHGHINPMLHLAAFLFRRGFSITVVVPTGFEAPDAASFPDFRFLPIDGGVGEPASSSSSASSDVIGKIVAINAGCEAPFRECMGRMLGASVDPVACLVADAMLYFTARVAAELGVRRVVLRTSGAACVRLFAALPALREKGYRHPIQGAAAAAAAQAVPELPPYRVKELFVPEADEVIARAMGGITAGAALLLNTFEDLEPDELAALRRGLPLPIFTVGPLHKLSPDAPRNRPAPEHGRGCMEWLDRQAPNSVVYVSFGSLAVLGEEDVLELAWGLARSRRPFLWVLRPGSVRGAATAGAGAGPLPEEFAEETRGRGRVVPWAPQAEVLAHPAVAAFWTHCGWNSVMESICAGVPMLCRPSFTDQPGNARYASHVWGVAILVDDEVLGREEVEGAIGRLVAEEEGTEMRERAREMKEKAARCVAEGGSTSGSLDSLVDFLSSP